MKKLIVLFSLLAAMAASPISYAADGRVVLASDYYIVVQVAPEYLHRYAGGRMYSFLPSGVREGDAVSGIKNTWGRQEWHVNGEALTVGVEEYDMDADEAIKYFSDNAR